MINDSDLSGKLIFLTVHYDVWLRQVNSKFNIPMANRLAKIVKVFNWNTAEGKLLLEQRKNTGKWEKLNSKDFKFVLKIYCPDLNKNGKMGLTTYEVSPKFYPGTKLTMFQVVPVWMLRDLQKEEKDIFKVEKDSVSDKNRKLKKKRTNVSKRIYKKGK